ncbi:MAG: hypothetical protein HQ582_22045, partial [Planctomycetes bacterium]|nr:hypothetical protein [Planctomycetota bacterium]
MISEHSLSTFRDYVGDAFKAGLEDFPHYTLHGREHLEELDRLALLMGDAIPALTDDRRDLLRIAVVMHDFAMVHVPNSEREAELRAQMDPGLSFADIIRKTHQDEIERCLTDKDRVNSLMDMFTDVEPYKLEDACTVARYHRFHPLDGAPDHLKDLCALMRLIDELDIGPRRAPRAAYGALRDRMDANSRFHWLKHICTRPIERDATFTVETCNDRRSLRIWIAVKATEGTWEVLQEAICSKIGQCLDDEGANDVIRTRLGVEFHVERASEQLCGEALFLPTFVREDLGSVVPPVGSVSDEPVAEGVGEDSSGDAGDTPASANGEAEMPATENAATSTEGGAPQKAGETVDRGAVSSSYSGEQEFPVIAIPPETLPEVLCRSGRLSVIGNKYIAPNEEHLGGVAGAPSRFYVGSADCGKSRAATEWIGEVTGHRPSAWVVLRTDIGTVPSDVKKIRLDTSLYGERHRLLPQRAILFLDDLPANLPPPGSVMTPTDAVRRLFEWFNALPYFQERRVVGTIRAEDMHARPDWPDVLPSLGQELELVAVSLETEEQYRSLWEGMTSGSIFPSETEGARPFSLEIDSGFIEAVAKREANPEGVAVFVMESVMKDVERLQAQDADKYSASAVDTWVGETWPVLRDTYGTPARVFFTLARFLAAGSRPKSGFNSVLAPAWEYHEAFGPDLCELHDCSGEEYLRVIGAMQQDGHATGKPKEWTRPKWDFLLQAEALLAVELDLPSPDWFAERSLRLGATGRTALAGRFAFAGIPITAAPADDYAWWLGWGAASCLRANGESDEEAKYALFREASQAARRAARANPGDDRVCWLLGVTLGCEAGTEKDEGQRAALREEEIAAYRQAVEANPKNDDAWRNLGVSLGRQADAESDDAPRAALREEEI